MTLSATLRAGLLLPLWLLASRAQAQKLAAGANFSLAIHPDGTLRGWGFNDQGQTATGQAATYPTTATQVGTATWKAVAANSFSGAGIRTDGTLWTWGNGYLGDGPVATRYTPAQLGTSLWQSVALGTGFTLAVRQDGTLWAWGSNSLNQLGDGTTTDRPTPVQLGAATTWRTVYAGNSCGFALRQDGTLWAWGYNGSGQLGLGSTTTVTQPTQVGTAAWLSVAPPSAPLAGTTLAVRQDGTLWGWGSPTLLGSATTNQLVPTPLGPAGTWQSVVQGGEIGRSYALAVRQDGTLWAWGNNYYGQLGTGAASATASTSPVQVGTATTWQTVVAGATHTLAQRQDGSVWAWGSDGYGELGDGQGLRLAPAQVGSATWSQVATGYYTTWGIRQDGSFWGWGENSWGLAGAATLLDQPTPTPIGAGSTWQSVGEGYLRNAAVRQDGTLWAWGVQPSGAVVAPPQQLGTVATWRSTAAGYGFNLAIRQDGSLWAWGANNFGALGTGSATSTTEASPVQVGTATTWQQVSCGDWHAAGVRTDGTLWAWGLNNTGQVGTGSTSTYNYSTPVQVGAASTWRQVACGFLYTVALRQDGTLWAWGDNTYGQLGTGTTTALSQPTQVSPGTTWQWVEAGRDGTVAVRQDGTLWAWGRNNLGQLGQGAVLPVAVTQPTQVGTASNWQRAAVGSGHVAALRQDGTLWSWGLNDHGQLGNQPASQAQPQLVARAGTPLATLAGAAPATWWVAPNPARDYVQVLGLPAGPIAVQLTDALGRLVRSADAPRLSTQGLVPGLYLLRVSGPAGAPRTTRLLVE